MSIDKRIYTREKFLVEIRKLSEKLFSAAYPGVPIGCTPSQWREYHPAGWPSSECCERAFCNGDWKAMLASLGLNQATLSQAKTAANVRAALGEVSVCMERRAERALMEAKLDDPPDGLPRTIIDYTGLPVVGAPRVIERDMVVRIHGQRVVVGKRVETRWMLR